MRFIPTPASGVLLVLLLTACNRWQVEPAGPTALQAADHSRTIRVERQDARAAQPGAPLRRYTMPLPEVRRVATKRGDLKRIVGAIATVPLAYFAGSYLMQW